MSRLPIKGEPDFHTISDKRLQEYIELSQEMMWSFSECDKDIAGVLKKVWKSLVDENAGRVSKSAQEYLDAEPIVKVRRPVLRKSPVLKKKDLTNTFSK